jgi:septation ring formation regulator EzrA
MKRKTSRDTELELLRHETDLEMLERRLEDGYQLIEKRLRAGEDVSTLETFWISWLHEYESRCDELPLAA